jgi:predicted enzyme related to lactoylglutathione lyase
MFKPTGAFSGFAVNDLVECKTFYGKTLGLEIEEQENMGLRLTLPGGAPVFIYEKPNHIPATFTILNFLVDDIDAAVDALTAKGVKFIQYHEANGPQTDAKGIARGDARGPNIAWCKDPAGNFLAVIENAGQ